MKVLLFACLLGAGFVTSEHQKEMRGHSENISHFSPSVCLDCFLSVSFSSSSSSPSYSYFYSYSYSHSSPASLTSLALIMILLVAEQLQQTHSWLANLRAPKSVSLPLRFTRARATTFWSSLSPPLDLEFCVCKLSTGKTQIPHSHFYTRGLSHFFFFFLLPHIQIGYCPS